MLTDYLNKQMKSMLASVEGLHAIVITDRDGVPLLRVATESAPELALRPQFLATYGVALDQASKVGFGYNKHIVCFYDNFQLVLINWLPLLITLIADSTANTGQLLALRDEIDDSLREVRSVPDMANTPSAVI